MLRGVLAAAVVSMVLAQSALAGAEPSLDADGPVVILRDSGRQLQRTHSRDQLSPQFRAYAKDILIDPALADYYVATGELGSPPISKEEFLFTRTGNLTPGTSFAVKTGHWITAAEWNPGTKILCCLGLRNDWRGAVQGFGSYTIEQARAIADMDRAAMRTLPPGALPPMAYAARDSDAIRTEFCPTPMRSFIQEQFLESRKGVDFGLVSWLLVVGGPNEGIWVEGDVRALKDQRMKEDALLRWPNARKVVLRLTTEGGIELHGTSLPDVFSLLQDPPVPDCSKIFLVVESGQGLPAAARDSLEKAIREGHGGRPPLGGFELVSVASARGPAGVAQATRSRAGAVLYVQAVEDSLTGEADQAHRCSAVAIIYKRRRDSWDECSSFRLTREGPWAREVADQSSVYDEMAMALATQMIATLMPYAVTAVDISHQPVTIAANVSNTTPVSVLGLRLEVPAGSERLLATCDEVIPPMQERSVTFTLTGDAGNRQVNWHQAQITEVQFTTVMPDRSRRP